MRAAKFVPIVAVALQLLAQVPLPPPVPLAPEPPAPPSGEQALFRSTSKLVIINVTVKAKDGKFPEDLKVSDFTVTEDGKPQAIRVFELQKLEGELLPPPPPPPPAAKDEKSAEVAAAEVVPEDEFETEPIEEKITTFAPPLAGQDKFKDKRLMVLYFDMAGMPIADQLRAQEGALKFINTQMTVNDMVGVLSYTTDLNVLLDFTDDRDALLKSVKGLVINDTGMNDGATAEDAAADETVQDDSEFNLFNTDRKMAALEDTTKMLGQFPEKKTLVYFASGMSRNGADNQAQLSATVNAAVRNNVAFYPVDTRGLQALAPAGNASSKGGGAGVYSGSSQRSARSSQQSGQDSMYTLAADTGGKALLDANDLSVGIVQAQKDVTSYYILGYYTTNESQDGKFRNVKVTLGKNIKADLDYRTGYYADKTFKMFTSADRDRQLMEALALGNPVTDLALALEVDYFRMARDRYFIPISVKIPGSGIDTAKAGGKETTRLDFIGQVRDKKGQLQGSMRDYIEIKLKGEAAADLAKRNLAYDTGFTLPPGEYSLKFLARENETGKMGTFQTKFTVPDLNSSNPELPTSSVILSNQRENLANLAATVVKDKRLVAKSPLIENNQKLIPSVTRVFRRDQNMYVFLEAYQPEVATTQLMVASVAFYRGKTKAFETTPLEIREGLNQESKAVPVRFSVPLNKLEPGRYTCQVTVLNPETQKFSVQRMQVVVLP